MYGKGSVCLWSVSVLLISVSACKREDESTPSPEMPAVEVMVLGGGPESEWIAVNESVAEHISSILSGSPQFSEGFDDFLPSLALRHRGRQYYFKGSVIYTEDRTKGGIWYHPGDIFDKIASLHETVQQQLGDAPNPAKESIELRRVLNALEIDVEADGREKGSSQSSPM